MLNRTKCHLFATFNHVMGEEMGKRNTFVYSQGLAIIAIIAYFVLLAAPSSAEVSLVPGKGRVLVRHDAGSINGYLIYHKWRRNNSESAVGRGWVSSLDVSLSKKENSPIISVTANCKDFVFAEAEPDQLREPPCKLEYVDDQYDVTFRNGTQLRFSSNGSISSIKNVKGETANLFTDDQGRINGWVAVGTEGGIIKWNKDGTVSAISLPLDSFSYEYKNGYLVKISSKQGKIWRYEYDEQGRPVSVIESEHVYTITYDTSGRVNILEDSQGETLIVEYEKQDDVSVVDVWSSKGTRTTYTFSASVTKIAEGPKDGEPVTVSEVNLLTGAMAVNEKYGTQVELMPATDGTYKLLIQSPGQLPVQSIIGPKRQVIRSETGKKRFHEISSATPDEAVKPHELKIQDAIVRGPGGEILKLISGGGEGTASYQYDARGELSAITFPDGPKALFEHDNLGRLTQYTDVFGATKHYIYDDNNGMRTEKLPNGKSWVYRYDPENRLIERRLPLGRITEYMYDDDGELTGITLKNFDTQQWFSSRLDDISSYSSSLCGNWFFLNLDEKGSTLRISPGGRLLSYYVDPEGRIIRIEDSNERPLATYEYDTRGNLIKAENDISNVRMMYDQYGRLVFEEDKTAGLSLSYSYNDWGLISASKDSDGHSFDYIVDEKGKLSEIRSSLAGIFKIEYGSLGLPVLLIRPNRVKTQWKYDIGGRLQVLIHALPDGSTLSVKYQYDMTGNIIKSVSSSYGTTSFSYDGLSQLEAIKSERKGSVKVSYDAWGNLLKLGDRNFKYSSPGKLQKAGDNDVITDEANRIERIENQFNVYEFQYDWDERLVKVTEKEKVLGRWQYGPLGRTVRFSDQTGSNRYVYAIGRLYGVKRGNAKSAVKYIIIPGIEECVAVIREDGRIQFPLTDSMGSIVHLTDKKGRIIASREFDFFGVPMGEEKFNLSLGYVGGMSFMDGNILFLEGQQYWLSLSRTLAGTAIQPGTKGLRENNPVAFTRANLNSPGKRF
jgi:YD repeat-containing protein